MIQCLKKTGSANWTRSRSEWDYNPIRLTRQKRALCGWVLRTFSIRKKDPMLLLWRSLIRSKLEYCCQLWCPTQTRDIQSLEQVQRNFIHKIYGIQHLSYWQQLQELYLYSLEQRIERYILLYIWQIIEGNVPNIDSPDHAGIKVACHPCRGRSCSSRGKFACSKVLSKPKIFKFWSCGAKAV